MGFSVAAAATALGARVIEKHFILDRSIGGPDASFSMTPDEFKTMVETVREVEKSLGTVSYEMTDKKQKNREFCRSLFVAKDVKAGDIVTKENVRSVRPGFGMAPKYLENYIGKSFAKDVKAGQPFDVTLVD